MTMNEADVKLQNLLSCITFHLRCGTHLMKFDAQTVVWIPIQCAVLCRSGSRFNLLERSSKAQILVPCLWLSLLSDPQSACSLTIHFEEKICLEFSGKERGTAELFLNQFCWIHLSVPRSRKVGQLSGIPYIQQWIHSPMVQ